MTGTLKPFVYQRRTHIGNGWERVFRYEFDLLERHREHAALAFEMLREKLVEDMENSTLAHPPVDDETAMRWDEIYAEEAEVVTKLLPRLQWNAQFLVVFATFENMMNRMCRVVQTASGQLFSVKDVNSQGIDAAKFYLKTIAGLTTPWELPAWKEAQSMKLLRNKIIHEDGQLGCDRSDLLERIEAWRPNGAQIDRDLMGTQHVLLSDEFISYSIATFQKVVECICEVNAFAPDSLTGRPSASP